MAEDYNRFDLEATIRDALTQRRAKKASVRDRFADLPLPKKRGQTLGDIRRQEQRRLREVPMVDPQNPSETLPESLWNTGKKKAPAYSQPEFEKNFNRKIEDQGGWGISDETRESLGGTYSPVAGLADLGFRAIQGLGAGLDASAEGLDDIARDTGLAENLSVDGNEFLPGTAAMALLEAFPMAGAEYGAVPRPAPRVVRAAEVVDDEADLARLANGPRDRVEYLEPNIPESVHPADEFLSPPKGGLESGRGMDERELARYNKRVWREKVNQERPLGEVPADDLLAMPKTPEVLDEFRRRNQEEFGVAPVRGADDGVPPTGKKAGGIGPGQGVVPKGLDEVVERTAPRSREATRAAAEETELADIGDVSAIAARGQAETSAAARRVMESVDQFGPGSDEALEAITAFGKIASQHSKNSSELGRGLNILNNAAAVRRFQELASDPANADKFSRLIRDHIDDPAALEKIARDSINPTIRDRIFSLRYNMMLSGPKTHVYNILGNTANIAVDLAEHGAAATLGQFKKLTGNADRVSGRELGARLIGAVYGARVGLKNMKKAFKEGRPLDDASRAEMARGRVGVWELPIKAIAAEDEFFRSVAEMSNNYGMAVRKAVNEGGDVKAGIEKYLKNPTDDIIADTKDYAKRMRFQDDPSFIGQAIENMRTRKPNDKPLTKLGRDAVTLILPFVRTPDSLARTAIRRSPLGLIEGVNYGDLKAGGARRDLAVSRIAMGSGVTAYVAGKVLDGAITGEGPRDYKKRQALEMTGWQPNSIKVGDKYYSYAGLEPLSIILNGVATTMERWDEGDGKGYVAKAGMQAANAAEVLTNQSYAENVADLFDALDAPPGQREAAINNFIANITQSFVVPAAVRQTNQAFFDSMQRDTRGDDSTADRIVNRIQSGVPGLSDNLPAQVDALGNEIGRGDAFGPDILSRAYTPLVQGGPVADELKRLMDTDPEGKVVLGRVDRSINDKSFPIGRLTAQEHHDYQQGTGMYFSAMMEEEMAKPEYAEMSDDEKRELVKDIAKDARKFAKEDVFESKIDAPEGAEAAPTKSSEEFTFGVPTSGTRSPAKNEEVGGVTNSDHLSGNGMDFVPAPGVSWKKLYAEAKRFFGSGAKVIHEKPGFRNGAYHGEHIHVSLPGLNAPEF